MSEKRLSLIIFFLLNFLLSSWFRGLIRAEPLAAASYLAFLLLLIYYLAAKKKNSISRYALTISFLILLIIQIQSVNIKNTYSFTPSEIDKHSQRMNYYPPRLARLGYILESKKEIRLAEKFIENFIEVTDVNTYFPTYFSRFAIPFFLVGFYSYFKKATKKLDRNSKMFISLFIFSTLIQSFVGTRGQAGPIITLSFIAFFVLFGVTTITALLGNYVKKQI